jgi:hypothetical protein
MRPYLAVSLLLLCLLLSEAQGMQICTSIYNIHVMSIRIRFCFGIDHIYKIWVVMYFVAFVKGFAWIRCSCHHLGNRNNRWAKYCRTFCLSWNGLILLHLSSYIFWWSNTCHWMQEADGNALITKSIDLCKDGHCSGTMKKRVSRVLSKKSHHWLPSIHEDYYGPRSHRPRHH